MKVRLLVVGKTPETSLKILEDKYTQRLVHYLHYERMDLPDVKNAGSLSSDQLKEKEGLLILSKVGREDFLALLDEKGDQFTSVSFSKWLELKFLSSNKRITFCVGGAYGFSKQVHQRADAKISLSRMTFSHQMVRTIFLEQLYRSCTLIKGEKYHHE